MKTIEKYMKLPYKMEIVEDPHEGGFVISFPELPGCLTCGETIEEALTNVLEAKQLWFQAMIDEGLNIPEPEISNKQYSGQFKLRIPKKLHRDLSLNAKKEGISLNQYCLYLLSCNNAIHSLLNK